MLRFLKGQGHQDIFSLFKKGTIWGGNSNFLLEHSKGPKAMAKGHTGPDNENENENDKNARPRLVE